MKNILGLLLIICTTLACNSGEESFFQETLELYLDDNIWENGAVIACAASDSTAKELWTFFYPENGVTNVRFYETSSLDVDPYNFKNYSRNNLESNPVFNGYIRKFVTKPSQDKWVIISAMLRDTIRISNPIKTKLLSKATKWNSDIEIDQNKSGHPKFSWPDNSTSDNAIYFQVVTDSIDNLISGTYTYENNFEFYNLTNVVLNITTGTPPPLKVMQVYKFTLMDVSEDNWVNLVSTKSFVVE